MTFRNCVVSEVAIPKMIANFGHCMPHAYNPASYVLASAAGMQAMCIARTTLRNTTACCIAGRRWQMSDTCRVTVCSVCWICCCKDWRCKVPWRWPTRPA